MVKLDPYDRGWNIIQKEDNRSSGIVIQNHDEDGRFLAYFGGGLQWSHYADDPLQAATNAVESWVKRVQDHAELQARTHYRVRVEKENAPITLLCTQNYWEASNYLNSLDSKHWMEIGVEESKSEIVWDTPDVIIPPVYI